MIDNSKPHAGGSGNVAVLVGEEGLLLVDDDAVPDARAVITELQGMFGRPIRYVVETACGGLLALSPEVETIIAPNEVRERVAQKKCWRGYPAVLPKITFGDQVSLYFDGEEVRVFKLPTGKTDGDATVYFKHANVVATGDTFTSSYLPLYTKFEGGNMLGIAEELRRIVALVPQDTKVIPGHGHLASMSDVQRASRALDEIKDAVAAQMAKGETLAQIQKMNLLERWKDLAGPQPLPYIKSFYDRISGPPEQEFQLSAESDQTH